MNEIDAIHLAGMNTPPFQDQTKRGEVDNDLWCQGGLRPMQFVRYTCPSDSVPRYLSAHLPLAIFDLPIVALKTSNAYASMEWVEYTSYDCAINLG